MTSRVTVYLQLVTVVVKGYHLPLSEDIFVHCWPLDANEEDDDTIDCNGTVLCSAETSSPVITQATTIFTVMFLVT